MLREFDSLEELKRGIYLWVLPFVTLATLINGLINSENLFDGTINAILFIWFTLSWFWAYFKRGLRFGEYSNLLLISLYLMATIFDVIYFELAKYGTGSLGDFIIWIPLYIMLIFVTLGIRNGLLFSITIFFITFLMGLFNFKHLSAESIDSLSQFYFATIVYILVLYYAQYFYRAYTEVELFKKFAYIDSLTRVANRHQIDLWLENKRLGSKSEHHTYSIIFFDIDHFKKVNDRHGHKIGDCVLKELASLICENLEQKDLFGRWGGEEFIIISDITGQQAVQKADFFRELVETHTFKGAGQLTASFGVTTFKKEDSIDSLLNRADEALYFSKNNGRNKVSFM